jgi:hypothetical protein
MDDGNNSAYPEDFLCACTVNKVSEKGSENKTLPEKHFFVNLTL